MRARKCARIVLILMVLLAALCPCIEIMDTWDNFALAGQDTDFIILVMLLMFGFRHAELALVVAAVATAQFLAALRSTFSRVLSTWAALVANPDTASKTGDLFPCLMDLKAPLRI